MEAVSRSIAGLRSWFSLHVRSMVAVVVTSLFGLLSLAVAPLAHAAVTSVTDSALITDENTIFVGVSNDFLNIFNNVTPRELLIVVAIAGLGFGVSVFRRFARPKSIH